MKILYDALTALAIVIVSLAMLLVIPIVAIVMTVVLMGIFLYALIQDHREYKNKP